MRNLCLGRTRFMPNTCRRLRKKEIDRGKQDGKEFSGVGSQNVAGVAGALRCQGAKDDRRDGARRTTRGAGDDAGASCENSGSESGGGVEAGAPRRYVREHAAKFRESDGG